MSTTYYPIVMKKNVPHLIGVASSEDELLEIVIEFLAQNSMFITRDSDIALIRGVAKKLRKTGEENATPARIRVQTGEDEFMMLNLFIQGR